MSTGAGEEGERGARARARVGQWVNRKWKLTELLGIGGTAAVHAATHRNGARVAIKSLHTEFVSDVERCARFQREGYAANLIQHPGVVSIHDDGIDEHGHPFLVMELLRGSSLQALLGASPNGLPLEKVLDWALSLLEILEHAHEKEVLHRDIKPSNLFLDDRGRLRVLDFGLAGGVAFESSTTTVSGAILGTPAFMPPEQARGDWKAVDARSDVWATGATLFTLLTGEHVHSAGTAQEQLGMAMLVTPRSLKKLKPELPDAVVELVDRALSFEPARRFQSAREMASACRGLGFGCSSGYAVSSSDDVAARAEIPIPLLDQRIDTQRTATFSLEYPAKAPVRSATGSRLDTRLVWGGLAVLLLVGAVAVERGARSTSRSESGAPVWKAPSAAATFTATTRPVAREIESARAPEPQPTNRAEISHATPRAKSPARSKAAPAVSASSSRQPSAPASQGDGASSSNSKVKLRSSGRLSDRPELQDRE